MADLDEAHRTLQRIEGGVALDPAVVQTSIAISLKRIADKLETPHVSYQQQQGMEARRDTAAALKDMLVELRGILAQLSRAQR